MFVNVLFALVGFALAVTFPVFTLCAGLVYSGFVVYAAAKSTFRRVRAARCVNTVRLLENRHAR